MKLIECSERLIQKEDETIEIDFEVIMKSFSVDYTFLRKDFAMQKSINKDFLKLT